MSAKPTEPTTADLPVRQLVEFEFFLRLQDHQGARPDDPAIGAAARRPLGVDRGQLLDAQAGANAGDKLVGLVDDADRVFVGG
jgi:hypothetical protein